MKYDLLVRDIPEWLRFPHVKSGYRIGGNFIDGLLSLFKSHNELINAWTMIIGSLISLGIFIYALHSPAMTITDKFAFTCLFLSAIVHMPFSVGYHLFSPISNQVFIAWRRLDLSFIFIASILLTYALSHYVFSRKWTTIMTSLSAITASVAIYNIYDDNNTNVERRSQSLLVGLIICVYMTPMVYQFYKEFPEITTRSIATITTFASLLVGGFVYALNFPECLFDQVFDIIGQSVNIMHICIIIAHISEFVFVYSMFSKISKTRT